MLRNGTIDLLAIARHGSTNNSKGVTEMSELLEIETMEMMAQRLYGTSGGCQANAVIEAIKLINTAPGMLDADNRNTALYHLAAALGGKSRAVESLVGAAYFFYDAN